jgi:hypothetical protein
VCGGAITWSAGERLMARRRIHLQPEKACELRCRLRATTVSVRDRQLSEIILLSAEGLTQQQIAERMGISCLQANRWVGRFATNRLAESINASGRGRKRGWRKGRQVNVGAGGDVAPHLRQRSCRTITRAAGISAAACGGCGPPTTSSRISRAPSNCRMTSSLKRSSQLCWATGKNSLGLRRKSCYRRGRSGCDPVHVLDATSGK